MYDAEKYKFVNVHYILLCTITMGESTKRICLVSFFDAHRDQWYSSNPSNEAP